MSPCVLNALSRYNALLAYAKNAKDDMTPDEKRMVATLAAALRTAWKQAK